MSPSHFFVSPIQQKLLFLQEFSLLKRADPCCNLPVCAAACRAVLIRAED
jgi:hypothetical protein